MTTTIKITELTNIGSNLASSTVIPVVNMAGTPTTEKAVLGNVANLVLAGAGGNYVAASVATTAITANTVLTNAQPNITSIGNLTGLTVSNASGVVNFSNTANVTLGAVGNLHIAGGSNSQVLSTDGAGNLTWTTVSAGSNYSNSNVANYLPTFTGNIGANVVSANTVIFSDGTFAVADIENTNNFGFETPANVGFGILTNAGNKEWAFNSDGSTIFPTLTVDIHNGGNQQAQTLQFGDATQQAIITGPTPATNNNAQRLIIQGQRASGTGEGGDVYLWAGDANTNGGDIKIYAGDADSSTSGSGGYVNIDGGAGFDNGGDITLTGGVSANSDGGSVSLAGGQGQVDGGPINIQGGYGSTGQGGRVNILGGSSSVGQSAYGNVEIGSGTRAWQFNNAGNLVLPTNGNLNFIGGGITQSNNDDFLITAYDNDGIASSSLELSPNNTLTRIEQWSGQDSNSWTTSDWATGTYTTQAGQGAVIFTGAPNMISFIDSLQGVGHIYFSVNGGPLLLWDGSGGSSTNITFYTPTLPATDPTTVTSFEYFYSYKSGFEIDYDSNEINIYANDADIKLEATGQRDIGLTAGGVVTITANSSSTWTFDNTGNLTLPGNIIGPSGANFTIYSNAAVHEFIFGDDGTFYAPDNVVMSGNSIAIGPGADTLGGLEHAVLVASSNHFAYIQGAIHNVSDNGSADWVAQGAKGDDNGGWADLGFTSSGFGDANYTITGGGDGYVFVQTYGPGSPAPFAGGGNLVLATGDQGTTKDIIFGTGGFLTSNIFGRISNANNALELSRTNSNLSLSGGGGIIGDGNLYIYPDSANISGKLDIYVTTGPDIHIDSNSDSNLIIGSDSGANLLVNHNGAVSIQTWDGNSHTWDFDNTGNLTLPTGGALTTTGNITATNFIGNGASLTNVTVNVAGNIVGTQSNVTLVAGSYSYTFDNAGTLTLPAAASGNEGGEIALTQAANSTLSGNTVVIDQYVDRIRFFEAGGTTRGAYIDFTQAADGVGTLLNNRVSGLVDAGTFVTMDLIKATVTSSGNRGLSLAATTGSFNILIGGNYSTSGGANGSSGSGTINTTPSASQFGWNFLSAGDTATYIITDTTNSRTYRITMQIGASFNNNLITIERLV